MTIPKSPKNKNMNADEEPKTRRKRIVESSSESDGSDCDEAASESESENSDDYRKLIAKLFPSKYMKKRVKEINDSKKSARRAIKKDIEESETNEQYEDCI